MPKDSFIFYRSYFDAIETLPVEQQQTLYRAIAMMSLNDKVPKVTGTAKGIFAVIQPQIKANKKRYDNGLKGKEFGVKGKEFGVLGKEFGVLGGRPITPGITPPSPFSEPPANENKNENENANENANENENANADAVIGAYNRVCVSLPPARCLTEQRRAVIRERVNEYGAVKLTEVFEKAEKSDFLSGRTRQTGNNPQKNNASPRSPSGWKASFDWLLEKANFVKVLEGNYDNKPPSEYDLVFERARAAVSDEL